MYRVCWEEQCIDCMNNNVSWCVFQSKSLLWCIICSMIYKKKSHIPLSRRATVKEIVCDKTSAHPWKMHFPLSQMAVLVVYILDGASQEFVAWKSAVWDLMLNIFQNKMAKISQIKVNVYSYQKSKWKTTLYLNWRPRSIKPCMASTSHNKWRPNDFTSSSCIQYSSLANILYCQFPWQHH